MKETFFTDPKVAISIFALLVSIGSLIWTLFNQYEQNRRWDELNKARVELDDVGLLMWKEMSRDDAFKTDWGYNPEPINHIDGWLVTDRVRLPFELIFVGKDGKKIPLSNGFFTLKEGEQETQRMKNLGRTFPASDLQIMRHYQVRFTIKNNGKVDANAVSINISQQWDGENVWKSVFKTAAPVSLIPGNAVKAYVDIYSPLNTSIPSQKYLLDISYNTPSGQEIHLKQDIGYFAQQNSWYWDSAK